MNKDISIKLTEDEAWVLFEFLRRFSDSEKLIIEDQSEERALWNLCAVFEKTLNQEEGTQYQLFIEECRNRLRDEI